MSDERAEATIGRYRLGPLLGRGGMAVVYEATDEAIGRTVALKLLTGELARDAAFTARFRREGRLQAALEHPNVVAVYEAGSWEHGLFIAMQLVAGPTLAALVDGGALTARRALALHRQVAAALDAAHAAGLVHRDVKPRNVLVAPGDHAYLADFGLTRLGDASGPTAAGNLVGTVAYLAPEVIRGEPATAASDRYAFAAMLFECLAGTAVFPRATHAALLYAHSSEPPPRISARRTGLPPALDDLFLAALSKQPGARPASAVALTAGVERVLAEHGALDLGPPPPPRGAIGGADATEPGDGDDRAVPSAAAPAGARGRRLAVVRGRRPAIAAALLAGALLGGATVAIVAADRAPPPAAVGAPPAGAVLLGSALDRPGSPRDCRGVARQPAAPACTILQDRLDGATLAVPRAGVVRRWGLRSARGEFALAVLRRRGGGYFQTARSRTEFVADGAVHTFAADLSVIAGDRLALVVVGGSAAGLRPAPAATTVTWSPPLRGDILATSAGPAGELLLRVDYVPGREPRLPAQVNGAAAAGLPDGEVVRRRAIRMGNGVAVRVLAVGVDGRYALDVLRGKRRVARMTLPGLAGEGRFVEFTALADDDPEQFYVYLEWVARDSERIVSRYIEGNAGELFFYG